METDKLEALLNAATPGPWQSSATIPPEGWNGFAIVSTGQRAKDLADVHGPQSNAVAQANAALIAAAPDLGAEVLRLRAEQSQTVAANAALAAENARLRDFIQELADAKPEVVKSPVDGDGYIEASYFWDWQSDAGKALAGKAGA